MNKKFFGIKLGTILQFLLCLVLAAVIWFAVQYSNSGYDLPSQTETAQSVQFDEG